MPVAERVARHKRPQLLAVAAARAVVDAVALRVEVLRLLQTACSVQPQRMAVDEAVVLPLPLSLDFHLLDHRPMETFWSRGIRSPRKKHGVDRQILRLVITRVERSRRPGISYSQASRVVCWRSRRIPASRFSVSQQDYLPAPARQ